MVKLFVNLFDDRPSEITGFSDW